jgi:hypothetical protein
VSYIPPASTFNTGFIRCPDFLPTDDTLKKYTASLRFSVSGQAGEVIGGCYGIYDLDWKWSTFKHLAEPVTVQPFGITPSYTEISGTLTGKPSSWATTICLSAPSADPAFGTVPSAPGPYPKTWLFEPNATATARDPNDSWGGPLTWVLSTENWVTETQLSSDRDEGNPDFDYYFQYFLGGVNPNTFSIYKNMGLYLQGTQTIFTTISAYPFDWDVKEYLYEGAGICGFESRGDFRLYTSNRYVLTGAPVYYQNISLGFNNVDYITVNLDNGQIVTLSGSTLYNDISTTYNIPGYKTVTSTVYYLATSNGVPVITNFTDIIKVIGTYDIIDTANYRTQKTPLTLPWPEKPDIAPNEWVNEDTINSVFKKFYKNLEYLNTRGRSYNDGPDEFYGWLGTVPVFVNKCPTYTWEDLDCLNGGIGVKWDDVQAIDDNFPTITTTGALASCCTWDQHTCKPSVQNPDRLGKYCIDWKWISRKSNVSTIPITWDSTKKNRAYNKKWIFEPCTTKDGLVLVGSACDEGDWQVNINKINTYYNPIVNCSPVSRCIYRDIVSRNNILYVALQNEVKVLSSDYTATFITSRMLIDELFAFKDIRGLALDSTNKLFVIDGTLNRVASYNINLTDPVPFELFLSWGGFGTSKSTSKFSRPNDICIDNLDNVWVADTGNRCVKQYSNTGSWLQTIIDDSLRSTPPISMTADSENNIHVLTKNKVRVYKSNGEFYFEYDFTNIIQDKEPLKINSNYNKEILYIIFDNTVLRYFRTGTFAGYLIDNKQCAFGIRDAYQDEYRNTLIISGDKILKYIDVMDQKNIVGDLPKTYWSLNELLIHKDEYIQNWVYNRSFHRLWDNIELLRHSLIYGLNSCKDFEPPKYTKEQILIGQNEIVTSTVINRNINYLWENLKSMLNYFDPNCIDES